MNVERRGPQVLDLSRGARTGPGLEIEASEAAEVVMGLFLLTGDCDFDTYDLPNDRLERMKDEIPPALRKELDELIAGSEVVAQLVGLVAELEGPRDVPALLRHIEELPAVEIQLMLLGYYQHPHPDVPREVIRAATSGDRGAVSTLKEAAADYPDWMEELSILLELGPERIKELLLSILPRWCSEVWPKFEIDLKALEADAREKRVQAKKIPLDRLIETATNGFQYTPDPRTRHILMLPSLVLSPWMVHLDHKDKQVICYPVASSSTDDGAMTPHQIARFYKALGDEGRLRLLKRLSEGSLTLTDAAAELGVAKSTAHHHLGLLRHAGLVLIREQNNEKTWSLRTDLLPQAGAILNSFLER